MMKRMLAVLAISACCTFGAAAQMGAAAAPAPGTMVEPAATFNALLTGQETAMVKLVQAMPADKFSWAPSAAIFVPAQKPQYTGVRTFAQLCIHVAQANYGLGSRIGGPKPTVDMKALGALTDKDQVVAALQASFAFVHQAINTLTPQNAFEATTGPASTRAAMAGFVAAHTADEYGQMVEYLRMNGMVPPASIKE